MWMEKSVNVISGVTQGRVLGPFLFILYISKLFHIVGNNAVGYADVAKIYAVAPRPLSRP